jgi:formate-dependent nitrite reductase membrane component NrfD
MTYSKMQTRQWMTTHKWMIKPMHQREWIERRGILIWVSEVFSSLGSGLFLVSLFLSSWWGLLVGWLIIMMLKLPIHVAYLGKPWRFYRLFPPFSNAWKTSWFARGVLFSLIFGTFGFFQLVVGHPFISDWMGPAARPIYTVLAIVSGAFALGVGMYGGMMMNYCKGIPFWNQGLLPIVIVLAGVADGFGLAAGIGMAGGDANVALAETGGSYLLLVNIFLIVILLMSSSYASTVSKVSIKDLLAGHTAVAFWLGLVVVGLIVPGSISLARILAGGQIADFMLIIAVVCHTVGAFALKYCLLKEGIYRPLLPRVAAY